MRIKVIGILFIIIVIILIIIGGNKKEKNKTEEINNVSEVIEEKETNEIDIFENYYDKANEKMQTLTLDEKIGQIFLVRYPEEKQLEALKKYKFGGYLFFERDFKNKTEEEIKNEIQTLQEEANIPLLIAVDEEGGKVVRVSSNKKLINEKFKSPMELYEEGGFDKIREDTIEKSKFLANLGINLNLAPVVDVSTDSNNYIYKRTLGKGTNETSVYAKTVIEASKEGKVSYTLKHFPGYGNNADTHSGSSTDNKSYEEIEKIDLPPFIEGIKVGAEAILVSHNVVSSIDAENPASLSHKMHELLRDKLMFNGVIITDDLYMGAVSKDNEAVVKAVSAGNDIIIVTDYEKSIDDVKKALQERKNRGGND